MRGKARPRRAPQRAYRITPAHAGKSPPERGGGCKGEDHPRPCGEKLMPITLSSLWIGSPPPMRGKVKGGRHIRILPRITPAHAGKSTLDGVSGTDAADHPRPCGEKTINLRITPRTKGSPPPMRGKVGAVAVRVSASGITPAHAGKSPRRQTAHRRCRDHPRPCGEKRAKNGAGWTLRGSPPPMRGKGEGVGHA